MRIQNTPGSYGIVAGLMVLLLAAVAIGEGGCAYAPLPGRSISEALEQTVKIDALCFGTSDATAGGIAGFYGSGVIVDAHTIITAGHVAADPDGFICQRDATLTNGHSYRVKIGKVLADRDLGTLILEGDSFDPTIPVVYGPRPAFGDHICAMVSFPMVLWRCGEAQGDETPPGDLLHTITVEPGNSGSGVYDMRGRLVGIITHRWSCEVTGQLCGGKLSTLEGHLHDLLRP